MTTSSTALATLAPPPTPSIVDLPDAELLTASAIRLAELLREGRISARALVELHIRQIERVNPKLNAVVAERFDAARAEADQADLRLRAPMGWLPPLLGVPCTIKECFALVGMPNTAGLYTRRGVPAERDATTVARLREAGAIPLGVTNTSEVCMWMETNNRVYGRTNNPYDLRRTVGGSSGGEGAIVAAGGSPFGLGSDIGGSIRMPAFFNGVFGHKATGGLVPGSGQWPMAEGDAQRFLTTGPLCRRAEDLMPLLELLAGPDGEDQGCRALPLGDPARVELGRLRILDVQGNGSRRVVPVLLEAQARAAAHLARSGAQVSEARFVGLSRSFDIWSAMLGAAESRSKFKRLLQRRSVWSLLGQLALWAVRLSRHTFPAIALGLIEDIGHWTPRRTQRLIASGRSLRDEIGGALGEDGVMLYPSFPRLAPRHLSPMFPPFDWVYTAIVNVMELPATQVPLGFSPEGLPLGVQVIAGPGQDHVCIAVAQALEQGFGGWRPAEWCVPR